ncbi:MAG: class I SAM-dependent methyltransferase [Clostridia bacterium]|nr:class I SAM-dependent methyltransferase [Clostridia bacterium]
MWAEKNWQDYELIDCSDGERLERWGKYILIRPDPQVIWKGIKRSPMWKKADAVYSRSRSGGGSWSESRLPQEWKISFPLGNEKAARFIIKPTGFKHTGLFPEQATNWNWFYNLIKNSGRKIKVLNLFAYTGGATVACAMAGAEVCHVDASKGMVAQAKQNMALNGLTDAPVRYIVDDCKKFCEREIRRGNRYDAIIMDPPSYGRGPNGEVWKLEESISELLKITAQVLSDNPLFFLLNSYTTGLSAATVGYLLDTVLKDKFGGHTESEEIGLCVTQTGGVLPSGASARWVAD